MRLHIDTDLGGDPDDACALAIVLGWPDVDLVGVTTTADPDGQRAGYVAHLLELVGRGDVPVVAGAGRSLTTAKLMGDVPDHDRYWGGPAVVARPGPQQAAAELLEGSIELGATVAAIGPYTNLAVLDAWRPGSLDGARVVAMGGWVYPPAAGLPRGAGEGLERAVRHPGSPAAGRSGRPHPRDLPAAMKATLRGVDLARLAESGPLGLRWPDSPRPTRKTTR